MGHLIPAGTGLPTYKKVKISLPFGADAEESTAPAPVTEEAAS